jgi:hypothetical protein
MLLAAGASPDITLSLILPSMCVSAYSVQPTAAQIHMPRKEQQLCLTEREQEHILLERKGSSERCLQVARHAAAIDGCHASQIAKIRGDK